MTEEANKINTAVIESKIDTIDRDMIDLAGAVKEVADSNNLSIQDLQRQLQRRAGNEKKVVFHILVVIAPLGIALFGFFLNMISANTTRIEIMYERQLTEMYKSGRQDALLEILIKDYQDGRK